MNTRMYKATVVLVIVAVLVVAIAWRLQHRSSGAIASVPTEPPKAPTAPASPANAAHEPTHDLATTAASQPVKEAEPEPASSASSPKPTPQYPAVIDLGMGKCIACQEMKPILEELRQEYRGRARIEIIDVGERPDQSDKYRIMLIPTQIFFDKVGKEVYRHEGFMPKADIVAKLKEMGVK